MFVSFSHVALLILHLWADNQNVYTYTNVLNQTGKICSSVKVVPSQVTTGNIFLTILSPRFFPVVWAFYQCFPIMLFRHDFWTYLITCQTNTINISESWFNYFPPHSLMKLSVYKSYAIWGCVLSVRYIKYSKLWTMFSETRMPRFLILQSCRSKVSSKKKSLYLFHNS